jgi:hypothetical protein
MTTDEMLAELVRRGVLVERKRQHHPTDCDGMMRCVCSGPQVWLQTHTENWKDPQDV